MVSYLGHYTHARTDAANKLVRAVESFLAQQVEGSELIVVADGCEKTIETLKTHYQFHKNISWYFQPKANGWPGAHRQFAVNRAKNKYITYLDSDDMLLPGRLVRIIEHLQTMPFVIDSNLTVAAKDPRDKMRNKLLEHNKHNGIEYWVYEWGRPSGTWCISHRKELGYWQDSPRRGEDLRFVYGLVSWAQKQNPNIRSDHYIKPIGGYLICHVSSGFVKCDF